MRRLVLAAMVVGSAVVTMAPAPAATAKKPTVTTTKKKATTKRPARITQQTTADCHPSYQGACVPVGVEDVDCAGGGGNGPFYVEGPIRVTGPDPYGLDRDGDGVACEPRPF